MIINIVSYLDERIAKLEDELQTLLEKGVCDTQVMQYDIAINNIYSRKVRIEEHQANKCIVRKVGHGYVAL